jgi:diacylglycerol kinase
MEQQKFSLRSRLKSFAFAAEGIREFLIYEHNARIHLVATVAVGVAAFAFKVSPIEWALLAIVTGAVWTAEMLNTCIEKIMDFVDPEEHPLIKSIKDLAAGAVLAAAFTAVVVGLLIFIPKML